ncbi:MAG: hypothetical protein Q8M95_07125 [Candidatus Methanoperedens sp.]|nr:hypothetical protein [Candidatus Methanoperedens sp.]
MKYTNRILASLVAAVFILSLFSGVVAAVQTPAEQYKKDNEQNQSQEQNQLQEQYRLHKEKYENTKKKFDDAKDIFEKAREKLRNTNDNNSREELKIKTKDYLIRAIDQTVSHLEILKYRVELRENRGIIEFDASGNIEAHITQLEEMKVKVEQAETARDFTTIHSELKDLWVKIRLETRYYVGIVLNYRSNIFLSKVDNVSVKMDEAITRLENEGIETTKLKAEAAKFDSIVAEAKQNQQKTDDLFEVHDGFASDGTVSDANAAREFLRQGDGMQRDTVKKLKDAAKQLKDFVKEFRKLARGKVTIEGSSTETLSGN